MMLLFMFLLNCFSGMTKKGEQTVEPENEKTMLLTVQGLESRWQSNEYFYVCNLKIPIKVTGVFLWWRHKQVLFDPTPIQRMTVLLDNPLIFLTLQVSHYKWLSLEPVGRHREVQLHLQLQRQLQKSQILQGINFNTNSIAKSLMQTFLMIFEMNSSLQFLWTLKSHKSTERPIGSSKKKL